MSERPFLPIDALLPKIVAALRASPSLVIEAAPGAGKTTRVPPALLELVPGEVIVLEPRRIAARMAARRVAHELGEEVGERVGYQVRFEEAIGPKTRLRFVTEGILTRRLLSDPALRGVDAVILDEFHERHLESDLALALLRRLQRTRPELKIVVMSATLDAAPVAKFLHECPVVRSEGRMFPLTIRHVPYSPNALEIQVRDALQLLLQQDGRGHILVFLPGAAEIRRAMRACEALAAGAGVRVYPLHGDLSPAEQDAAVSPSRARKLILATNVAESSVTVEGVAAVIDSGLARSASHSPWTGLPTLQIARISKASAKQRAGRAGRTGPGEVLRLYPEEDYAVRPEHDVPEILRSDLSPIGLALRAMKIPHFGAIEWLDAPPAAAVHAAEVLLDRLRVDAASAQGLARFPLPPRLAKVLVEALGRGVGEDGCAAVALLASGVRQEINELSGAMDKPQDARGQEQLRQLRRIARPARQTKSDEDALLISVLAGFPDRVARRRTENQILLSSGGSAEVLGEPPPFEFMVVLDAEDRREKVLPMVRMVSRVEPEWLLDLFPERVREETSVVWNRAAERVEAVSVMAYDELVIQEWRDARPEPAAAAAMLSQKALEAGLERFVEGTQLEQLLARIEFAGLEPPGVGEALSELCVGLLSFGDVKRAGGEFLPLLESKVDAQQLRELAPASIRLPAGRQVKVQYERGKQPWIASRLQDFFGMRETPRVGRDRTPLIVHLLAPNQRPVQTTTDLAGFWERLYPQVRRELMRRYPRHAWPERPEAN